MFTLFPPDRYYYFNSIKITGSITQSDKNADFAFAYFVPYIVEKPAMFVNCSVGDKVVLGSPELSHGARFAGYALAAYNDVYFYDVNTSITYTPRLEKGTTDRYGGLLAGAYNGVNVHLEMGTM